jgi:hypothetical protein
LWNLFAGSGGQQGAPQFSPEELQWLEQRGVDVNQLKSQPAVQGTTAEPPGGASAAAGAAAPTGGETGAAVNFLPQTMQQQTGLTSEQYRDMINQTVGRRTSRRMYRTGLRAMGLTGADLESLTEDQLRNAGYAPEQIRFAMGAKQERMAMRGLAGPRGFGVRGAGFGGARPTASYQAPLPPGGANSATGSSAPQQAASMMSSQAGLPSGSRNVATEAASAAQPPQEDVRVVAGLPPSGPPTEAEIGNTPIQPAQPWSNRPSNWQDTVSRRRSAIGRTMGQYGISEQEARKQYEPLGYGGM